MESVVKDGDDEKKSVPVAVVGMIPDTTRREFGILVPPPGSPLELTGEYALRVLREQLKAKAGGAKAGLKAGVDGAADGVVTGGIQAHNFRVEQYYSLPPIR